MTASVSDLRALHVQCKPDECREFSIRESVDDAITTSVPCPVYAYERALNEVHCAACTGTDYIGRPCRGRVGIGT